LRGNANSVPMRADNFWTASRFHDCCRQSSRFSARQTRNNLTQHGKLRRDGCAQTGKRGRAFSAYAGNIRQAGSSRVSKPVAAILAAAPVVPDRRLCCQNGRMHCESRSTRFRQNSPRNDVYFYRVNFASHSQCSCGSDMEFKGSGNGGRPDFRSMGMISQIRMWADDILKSARDGRALRRIAAAGRPPAPPSGG